METEHVSGALGDLVATARSLASKHGLERDGVIVCWNCEKYPALMPSLHCPVCLAAYHRRRGTVGITVQRQQTPADVEACRHAIARPIPL